MHQSKTTACLFIGFALAFTRLTAQVSGVVTDPAGVPLAFVTVLFNDDPARGVYTDIDGRFRFENAGTVRALTFRYVGFATLRLEADFLQKNTGKTLQVVLQPSDFGLPEAVVIAGENPADILIRRAVANRNRNNPEKRSGYLCTTYNKITVDVTVKRELFEKNTAGRDTTKKRVREQIREFDQLEKSMREHHGFLLESVTKRRFKAPNLVEERVVLNRVSGFRNTGLVALANAVQPFTFYGDYLRILDKDFVNPISPGSPGLYFFNIEDTLYAGPDTVWVISFRPRKGAVFTGLDGVLHLHSKFWAVQTVRAHPAAANDNLDLKIEQSYRFIDDAGMPDGSGWFPDQLNFEFEFKRYPAEYSGLRAAGRSYITDAAFQPDLRLRDFDLERPLVMEPFANTRADSAWARWRTLTPLSDKEWRTYSWLDSLGAAKKLDALSSVLDCMVTGRVPLYKRISFDLTKLLKINEFEQFRLGFGLSTAQNKPLLRPRRVEWSAYAGYGVRDKRWKYGGYALWRIVRGSNTYFRAGWQRDLREPGALYELEPSAFVNRNLYATRMDYADEYSAQLGSRLWNGASVQATFRRQQMRPAYAYTYESPGAESMTSFIFSEATLYLRWAYGEQARSFLGSDFGAIYKWPAVEMAYTRGVKGLWHAGFDYERWSAALYQSFFIRRLGRLSWRLEAGMVSSAAPVAKLFSLNQAPQGNGSGLFAARNTFQALPDTLFLADRFVNFYFSQEIGPVLYRSKYSAPFLTLLQNAAWGDLRRPELHRNIGFRTASQTLLESGIQLDHLLVLNYVNAGHLGLGGAAFYRWGGLQAPKWQDNISLRLSMRFMF